MESAPVTAAPTPSVDQAPSAPAPEKSVAERAQEFLKALDPDPKPAGVPEAPAENPAEAPAKEPGSEEPEKVDPPEEKPAEFAKKFAALTRKERAQYERDKSLKAREAKVSSVEKLLSEGKSNPEALLAAAGVSLADVAQYVMRRDNLPGANATKEPQPGDEIKKLREELAERDRKEEAKQAEATRQAAIGNLATFVKNDAAKYPVCGEFIGEAIPFALDIAWQYRQTYGKDPEVPEVFEKVEAALREKKTAELQNLKKISLFSDYFKASSEEPKANGSNGQAISTPTKTLTNAPVVSAPESSKGFRSDDERIRYFASMIKDR